MGQKESNSFSTLRPQKYLPSYCATVLPSHALPSRRPTVLQTALPRAYGNPDPGPFPLQHHPPGIRGKGESLDEAVAPLARNDGPAQLFCPNLLGVLGLDSPLRSRRVEDDLQLSGPGTVYNADRPGGTSTPAIIAPVVVISVVGSFAPVRQSCP